MGVCCAVPSCNNKWKKYLPVRFFRLPLQLADILKQWLIILNIDLNTPKVRLYNVRVCSDHFIEDDYNKPVKNPTADSSKCRLLKKTAVPSVFSKTPRPLLPISTIVKKSELILDSMDFSKDENSADELEVILSSDELLSDSESSEEEEKKKKKKRKKDSSDEWEPPMQETVNESENSEVSEDEEESEECDGDEDDDDGSRPVVICEACGCEARLQCSLLRHEKVFACAKCFSGNVTQPVCVEELLVRFGDFQSFQVHAEEEHGVVTKRLLCQECGVFYVNPSETKSKKEHVCEYKTKHVACLNCDKRFLSEKGLKSHVRKLHGHLKHPCKYCLTPFRNRPAKLQHEETHPKEEKTPYLCPDCPEKFSNILKRNRHLKSHRGRWNCVCKTCGKGFLHLHTLERHQLIHSGEKPFKCEVCDRSFTQEGHLKSHTRVHTGEKPYTCKMCSKSFNHNVSLKSHVQRYHSSEAPAHPKTAPQKPKPKPSRKATGRPRGRPKRASENQEQENHVQIKVSQS